MKLQSQNCLMKSLGNTGFLNSTSVPMLHFLQSIVKKLFHCSTLDAILVFFLEHLSWKAQVREKKLFISKSCNLEQMALKPLWHKICCKFWLFFGIEVFDDNGFWHYTSFSGWRNFFRSKKNQRGEKNWIAGKIIDKLML